MASMPLTKNLKKTVEEPVKENGIWIFSDMECKADKIIPLEIKSIPLFFSYWLNVNLIFLIWRFPIPY